MFNVTIYRGTHQIGGCCTELACKGERVLIDLGANLPDSDTSIRDDELAAKVFDGRPVAGVLFTHPHGDHYGLYKKVPGDVPMYIGPMAKEILKILVSRLDHISGEKGLPAIERMQTYQAGRELGAFQNVRVLPLYVDHSAPDAYMFYIQAAGKKILFSGDFRDHGIVGEKDRLWRTLEKFVPRGIDLLITEGTMLSRRAEAAVNSVWTEEQLGQRAKELFRQHKYNFVLVSSTNLDSIMEFYHHTPEGMQFVCDTYQAEVMLTAMKGMEAKGNYPRYQCAARQPVIQVLNGNRQEERMSLLSQLGAALKKPVGVEPAGSSDLYHKGFVMLARKNAGLSANRKNVFEIMRDKFYPVDGQIIYSMWDGYLKPEHADQALINFIGGRPIEHLHTSGHAYVETIARLIETVDPKVIVPMHTERAEEFSSIREFAPYKDRVRVLKDGEPLSLESI
jgi:ribonuclease J